MLGSVCVKANTARARAAKGSKARIGHYEGLFDKKTYQLVPLDV
jgi:hypothetical protein